MNKAIIAAVLVAGVGSLMAFRSVRRSARRSGASHVPSRNPADTGRGLRLMMLTTPPERMGVKPTEEVPRVYAVLMDWPIDDQIASVFASSTGAASLYTTSTFGVLGGERHEAVRNAAKTFVRASDRYLADAQRTTEFPYPGANRIRFYLLTFDGVRVIDTDLDSVTNGTSKYVELFALAQAVLTELRPATQSRP